MASRNLLAEEPQPSGKNLLAEEPKESAREGFIPASIDVVNRSLVAGTLGAPADIGALLLRPFGYKEEPTLGSEYIGRKMEEAGFISPKRRPVAELLTSFAPLGVTGLAAGTKFGVDLARKALGRGVASEAEAVKKATVGKYEEPIAEAARERERASRVISQMERQPSVAAERAAIAPLTEAQRVAQLQSELRQPVREAAGAKRVKAEQTAAEAAKVEELALQRTAAAEQAVNAIEQRMMQMPTMNAEQFGTLLRNATQTMNQRLLSARTEGSGLNSIITNAGDDLIVDTAQVIERAKEIKKRTRNPQVAAMMDEVQALAKTDKEAALSLYSADSLRKYLSKDIINKFFPQTGADKEVLTGLKALRGALITKTPQQYREGLGKFSELSRPLDIVERQGSLKRVLDIDPVSTAEKLTEAEVVGEVIRKANRGNPVFSRLLEVSPSLKDSARLYFTQDLFAKGVVPSEASVRTWLAANQRSLQQLGLYDEFKNLRTARETAQRAVDDAKLTEKAVGAVVKEARAGETAAEKLSRESERRLQEALKTTAGPTQRPGETLAEALRRTRTGEKPVPIQTFIQSREKQIDAIRSLTKMQDDVNAARDTREVVAAVNRSATDLLNRGIIDDAGYRTMLRDVARLEKMEDAKNQSRKILAFFGGALGVGWLGRRAIESTTEGK